MGLVDRAAVPAAQVLRHLESGSGQADHRGLGQHLVGHLLDPAPGLVGTGHSSGSPPCRLPDHVTPAPGGRRSAQLGQALGHHVVDVEPLLGELLLKDLLVEDLG